jgi:hypothetical protein
LKVLVINPSRTFHAHEDRVMPAAAATALVSPTRVSDRARAVVARYSESGLGPTGQWPKPKGELDLPTFTARLKSKKCSWVKGFFNLPNLPTFFDQILLYGVGIKKADLSTFSIFFKKVGRLEKSLNHRHFLHPTSHPTMPSWRLTFHRRHCFPRAATLPLVHSTIPSARWL